MTIQEVFEQAKALTKYERKELAVLLIDSLDIESEETKLADEDRLEELESKTGAEIAAMIREMQPIDLLVDSHIEDPVEWVMTQRQKRQDYLNKFWNGEE